MTTETETSRENNTYVPLRFGGEALSLISGVLCGLCVGAFISHLSENPPPYWVLVYVAIWLATGFITIYVTNMNRLDLFAALYKRGVLRYQEAEEEKVLWADNGEEL